MRSNSFTVTTIFLISLVEVVADEAVVAFQIEMLHQGVEVVLVQTGIEKISQDGGRDNILGRANG